MGGDGAGVPFLRYLPERVEAALRTRLAGEPSFVAYEGYDAVLVLADVLRTHGVDRARVAAAWSRVATPGTVRFSRPDGSGVWQWAWPPVRVVERDPERPDRFRVVRTG